MIRLYLTLVAVCASIALYGQNEPVPDYLTKQDFPDSVMVLKVTSLEGKQLTFSEMINAYQGKTIVVDMWASWCRDCIVGLPKLEKLKKETGEELVVYLFLSVDKDDEKWRSAIKRFNIRGEHYRIEGGWKTPLANYIVLDWVPRYMVLNQNGRVVMPKAIEADEI
jgi:thiol-disulfide isomerase/thioredoxin